MQQTRINQFYRAISNKMRPKTVDSTNPRSNLNAMNFGNNEPHNAGKLKKSKRSLSNSSNRSNEGIPAPKSRGRAGTSPKKSSKSSIDGSQGNENEPSELFNPKKTPESVRKNSPPAESDSKQVKTSPKSRKTLPIKFLNRRSSRRLFKEPMDADLISRSVENLNLTKSGWIAPNDFDLEEVYKSDELEISVPYDKHLDTFVEYDVSEVNIPRDKHAAHFFNIVTDVFSDPLNCGYFNHEELSLVFAILSLSNEAQMLLSRMIKRKSGWHRVSAIQYPEIATELKPWFDELESRNLCSSDTNGESLETLLKMLRAEEVRLICQKSKLNKQGNKNTGIQGLIKIASSVKSLFPGMDSPATALRRSVVSSLGHCVRLSEKLLVLVDRIVTLFVPTRDVAEKLSDLFLTLTMIQDETMRFPEMPVKRYPVFSNRKEFVGYAKSRDMLRRITIAKEEKDWSTVLTIGRDAWSLVVPTFEQPPRSKSLHVPRHVEKFREEYVWMKIVDSSLEAFKKENSTIPELVDMLRRLASQKNLLQGRKGQWYAELALIEMHYNKNLETSAQITLEGLAQENLSDADRFSLVQRVGKLLKRKSGLSSITRDALKKYSNEETSVQPLSRLYLKADAVRSNIPGRKSTWSLGIGDGGKGYMKVEERAMYHYNCNGYPQGWHCEGALPLTLFALAMWDEIYGIPVPAAYLCAYQSAPLDIYTGAFYDNRKEPLDHKLALIETLSSDELSVMMGTSFEMRQCYVSILPSGSYMTREQIEEIVRCLGTVAVTGICKRIASNFLAWRSGFPDLIVWNPETLKCKIIEVKGPGDKLSVKQILWIQYLEELGIDVELCSVAADNKRIVGKQNEDD